MLIKKIPTVIETPEPKETPRSEIYGNGTSSETYTNRCVHDSLWRSEAPFSPLLLYRDFLHKGSEASKKFSAAAGLSLKVQLIREGRAVFYMDKGMSALMKRALEHYVSKGMGDAVVFRRLNHSQREFEVKYMDIHNKFGLIRVMAFCAEEAVKRAAKQAAKEGKNFSSFYSVSECSRSSAPVVFVMQILSETVKSDDYWETRAVVKEIFSETSETVILRSQEFKEIKIGQELALSKKGITPVLLI